MTKRKTTIYVDEDLLKRVKILAARTGKKDSEVVEDALRSHLGLEVIDRIRPQTNFDPDEALRLAYEALDVTRPSPR